jgi:pyruvate kinase
MIPARLPQKKTKIVCTIGPASQEVDVLEQMIAAGMNVARINFAHGDFESHARIVANVRAAAAAQNQRVAIFGDLPGPKMRIGTLAEEPVYLERDQQFVLQTAETVGDQYHASLDFATLPRVVKRGDHIYMNDGYIQLEVEGTEDDRVITRVVAGGELRSNKGVNFPGIDLGISAFTEADRQVLAFAAEQQLDAVSQSFVRGPEDVIAVRDAAQALSYSPFIIAKIERAGALEQLEGILEAADGIMVARGDLGVEIPIEEIPGVQKSLIRQSNLRAKPVITATQMLESMTDNRRPTRAEATDVANAILDGTDCVMLSGETAVGRYPIETVAVMARIARETESSLPGFPIAAMLERQHEEGDIRADDLMSLTVFHAAQTLAPVVVFAPSRTGGTARRITRYRLDPWIVAPSQSERTCQILQLSFGVYPVHVAEEGILAEPYLRRQFASQWLRDHALDEGVVLLVESSGTLKAEDTKRIDIIALGK